MRVALYCVDADAKSAAFLFVMHYDGFDRRIWCDCLYKIWDCTCVTQLKTSCTRYNILIPVAIAIKKSGIKFFKTPLKMSK